MLKERDERIKFLSSALNKLHKERANEKAIKKEIETKRDNFRRFKNRGSDVIIGRAHIESGCLEGDLPYQIYVEGNMGTSYYPKGKIISTTKTYFHNVWTSQQRSEFQKRLNKFIDKEIAEIMNSAICVIELMGLITFHDGHLKYLFQEDKIEEVKTMVWKERFKILNNFDIKELKRLYNDWNLCHGKHILKKYLKFVGEI